MPFQTIGRQRYYYEDTGGDKPAIFFLHGMNMDHEMFEPQIEALRDRYRCIAWDERGHGLTEEDGQPWDLWELAEDGVALLHALGIESAIWVGMSQGGMMTLRAALAHPEAVEAMILIDTEAGPQDPASLPGFIEVFDDWHENGPDKHSGMIADLLVGSPELSGKWLRKWSEWDPKRMRNVCNAVFERDDIRARLGEIDRPAIVFHGTADAALPIAHGEALADGLPGSPGLVKVPDGTHASNLTHPAEVNAGIEHFLLAVAAG